MPATLSADTSLLCPFTIVVDSNEAAPFHFTGITADGKQKNKTWIVPTVTRPLYQMGQQRVRVPNGKSYVELIHGWADYSIDGMESRIQIERKSVNDLYGTIGGRRFEFQAEMMVLNECDFAAVVIEGDWRTLLEDPPCSSQVPPKVISRTILSWSIRYPRVHWFPCMNRRHAELVTFHLLMKFWEHEQERLKLKSTHDSTSSASPSILEGLIES